MLRPLVDLRTLDESHVLSASLSKSDNPIWIPATNSIIPYSYDPEPRPSVKRKQNRSYCTSSSARLAWGSAQEATAILATLNYLSLTDPGTVVHEAGMFMFEALQESAAHRHYLEQQKVLQDILGTAPTPLLPQRGKGKAKRAPIVGGSMYEAVHDCITRDRELPLLGASPDGVIVHPDGCVEVLEVKCVSPFIDNNTNNNHVSSQKRRNSDEEEGVQEDETNASPGAKPPAAATTMRVVGGFSKVRPGASIKAGFGVWHVPQLMLEMFCVGAHCRSAVMTILSVSGARIYRLQRDDEVGPRCTVVLHLRLKLICYDLSFIQYIAEMLNFIREFYMRYISSVPSNKRKPPPPNFFNPRTSQPFALLLRRTVELAESAELLTEIRGEEVQRSAANAVFFL